MAEATERMSSNSFTEAINVGRDSAFAGPSIDLASERLGGAVIATNDDFFAPKENLVKASAPMFLEHEYTERGKWMDGWESRRRRTPGFDWCIVRLGLPGVIRGVVIDTAFFRGNYPEHASLEACAARPDAPVDVLLSPATRWVEILPRSPLRGDSRNAFPIASPCRFTHVRLNIFPDGGVARLRVHGEAVPDWQRLGRLGAEIDLAAVENGGTVPACSDMFFGVRHNLIQPGRAANMGDGWETRRRRGPGHDWALVALAAQAEIHRIEIDTNHFKGNYPDTCSIEVIDAAGADPGTLTGSKEWREILPRTKLQAHTRHFFDDELTPSGPVTHLRLNIYPDGGVSRLRVWGTVTRDGAEAQRLRRLNALIREACEDELLTACGSRVWAVRMAEARPFADAERLYALADQTWAGLSTDDWLEAFRAHPRIGERRGEVDHGGAARRFSAEEQRGVGDADGAIREALAEDNRAYEARFGHIFIVCATGKSAAEMLEILRARLGNAPETEVAVAAEEQRKITRIRLEKMLRA